MVVISDISAVTNLFQVGKLDLLHNVYGQILITPAVKRELSSIPSQSMALAKIDWLLMSSPNDQSLVSELNQDLDLGEAESIALAIEKQADYLIIDEHAGRKIAQARGVKIVGVLGILIACRRKNLIEEIGPIIV